MGYNKAHLLKYTLEVRYLYFAFLFSVKIRLLSVFPHVTLSILRRTDLLYFYYSAMYFYVYMLTYIHVLDMLFMTLLIFCLLFLFKIVFITR